MLSNCFLVASHSRTEAKKIRLNRVLDICIMSFRADISLALNSVIPCIFRQKEAYPMPRASPIDPVLRPESLIVFSSNFKSTKQTLLSVLLFAHGANIHYP